MVKKSFHNNKNQFLDMSKIGFQFGLVQNNLKSEIFFIREHVVPGLLGVLLHSLKLCVQVPHNNGK